jgi:sodium transport system permease protein
MSKKMIAIMKKEFARFFGDKRLVFTTILMPGLMIYILYTLLGQGIMKQFAASKDYVYQIYTVDLPEAFSYLKTCRNSSLIFSDRQITVEKESDVLEKIEAEEADLLMVFQSDFDAAVAAYDPLDTTQAAPDINMYYNSVSTESSTIYNQMYQVFDDYESSLANKFDINAEEGVKYDVATEKDTSAQLFSMLLPMLLMSFLFSGCMAVAPESIVGEKERGTIATLLVTPMKRSELAVGKVLSLSVIGLLGGVSSFIGTMLALPNLMGGAALEDDSMTGAMSAAVYSGTDYVLLLFVILSTVLVIIGAISLMSGLAKSVKEAGTMVSPLMIVVMLIGVSTMFGDGAPKEVYWYLIPFYNSVQCMNGIFSFDLVPVNFVVTIVANLLYALVMTAGLAKIFDSEKIMYS